ncbi:hypothetical protein LY28_00446 [Ruminiclostridium sufflavum DSM 19573]|uniref:Uncharacterized protein n=1 Tax=Ruminiclostridium sufflavum DSM 19573 TaxID=1121337 RepID=A0A318XTN4_9FIRM|nr:DNA-binding response regulator [Ruminiclostridium sufflavum]PYG89849.1 hypothetical protein LY28_00446 [Ruminiclostridium sufflavum DSM 19573]
MEAFYVCIIFLGIILVVGSIFLIIMDRVSGKDFFKEFDRKKDEMFNLIQDSEEMVQELNKMSDYVVTMISEKNQEFFNKNTSPNSKELPMGNEQEQKKLPAEAQEEKILQDTQEAAEQGKLPDDKKPPILDEVAQRKDTALKNRGVIYEPKDSVQQKDNSVYQNKGLILQYNEAWLQNKSMVIDTKGIVSQNEATEPDADGAEKDAENQDNIDLKKPKLALSGKRSKVLELIERGLSDEEISEKLRIGKGEISLIRGLSK